MHSTNGNRTPLVICVGNQNRQWFFEHHDLTTYAYPQLGAEVTSPNARHVNGPQSPVTLTYGDPMTYGLDKRLYRHKLEGRRVVVLAPPYQGSRKNNPVGRLEEQLREEGARVSIVRDALVEVDEFGKLAEHYEVDEQQEIATVEEVKAAAQTFGTFRRKRSRGEKPEVLIEGVLFRKRNHIAFGGAGQGKTMLACYLSSELIKRGETVVYLDRENGEGRIFDRMHALGCTEEQLEEHFYFFAEPQSTLEDAPDYRELLREVKPALVIFDSLFGFMTAAGLDENHGPHFGSWVEAYAPPNLECATLILDHTPKRGNTERGTGRKRDAVDVSWRVKGNFSTDRVGPLKLHLAKARDGGLAELVSFTFGGTPLVAERGDARQLKPEERTLDALDDSMTAGEWLDASGLSEPTFFRHRRKLIKDERVEKNGDSYYHVIVEELEK
jgi:hypothetical protein